MKRVLLFAPFGNWLVHHQLDAVVGAALKRRGCVVRALCCDGIFRQCMLAADQPTKLACQSCHGNASMLFNHFDIPMVKLGSLVTREDIETAKAWTEGLPAEDLTRATFEGRPLWNWSSCAVYSRLRSSRLDSSPETEQFCRDTLFNSAILTRSLSKFLSIYKPDQVICFNGGHPYYRIAYELSLEREIHVLVHERGHIDDTFLLLNDRTNHVVCREFEEWPAWRNTPLNEIQLQKTLGLRREREEGKNTNFLSNLAWSPDIESVRWRLRIPSGARILTLFASGDWEFSMAASGGLQAAFESQREWIIRTADFCAREGVYLVVRHHPLGAGTKTYPRASDFIRDMLELNRTLGSHVRVIMPAEKLSSYDLVWNADASTISYSTISWESIMRGLWTTYVAESIFTGMGMDYVQRPGDYEEHLLRALRRTQAFGLEELRWICRMVHFLYFVVLSHRFKSFGIRDTYSPDIRVASFEDLDPGRDPMLDRVCEHILRRKPLYEQPDTSASAELEAEVLQREAALIHERRQKLRLAAAAQELSRREPSLTVLVPKTTEKGGAKVLEASLVRSRYRNITVSRFGLEAADGSLVASLARAVASAQSEFIHIVTDDMHVDEAAYSSAIDALLETGRTEAPGAAFGVYWCPGGRVLSDELFTAIHPASGLEEVLRRMPPLLHPLRILSLCVWRREALLRFLKSLSPGPFLYFSASVYEALFGAGSDHHLIRVPLVTLYAE